MRTFAQKPKTPQPATPTKSTILSLAHIGQARDANSSLILQRTIGNQAVLRLLQSNTEEHNAVLAGTSSPHFGDDFARIPVNPPKASALQTKPVINKPGDEYEQEADRVAEQVMRMPEPEMQLACACGGGCPRCQKERPGQEPERLQTKRVRASDTEHAAAPPVVHEVLQSPGQAIDPGTRGFMESRFGHDFSKVQIHASGAAEQSSRALNARAYTVGNHIVFGASQFAPGTSGGRRLLAHELTHVLQQTGGAQAKDAGHVPKVQREVQVRPPGRGEASAFDRRQELIDRMNGLSRGMEYRLDGRVMRYNVIDEAALTPFDRQMRGFIDQAEVVPMRLITGAGYVQGTGGAFEPLALDSFVLGYVDLDDLLASDDLGFQARLIHVLTERFATRDYERRIGTAFTMAEFNPAHRAAHEAEAGLFRDMIGDPTIRFLYAEPRPNGTWVVAFRSDEGYRIFRVVRGAGQEVRGANVWVQTRDGRRLTVDQLRAERAAAAAPVPAAP